MQWLSSFDFTLHAFIHGQRLFQLGLHLWQPRCSEAEIAGAALSTVIARSSNCVTHLLLVDGGSSSIKNILPK